jgi:hypothetical protein
MRFASNTISMNLVAGRQLGRGARYGSDRMADERQNAGKTALNRALALASKHASTAAMAAALAPLGMAIVPGTANATPSVSFAYTADAANGENEYAYTITGDGSNTINEVLIPEEYAGLFDLSNPAQILPDGATATDVTSSSTSGLDNSTAVASNYEPLAYIDITGLTLSSGSVEIDLYAVRPGEGATIALASASGGTFTASGGTPMPEPASMAVLGTAIAGFAGMRRRKKA